MRWINVAIYRHRDLPKPRSGQPQQRRLFFNLTSTRAISNKTWGARVQSYRRDAR